MAPQAARTAASEPGAHDLRRPSRAPILSMCLLLAACGGSGDGASDLARTDGSSSGPAPAPRSSVALQGQHYLLVDGHLVPASPEDLVAAMAVAAAQPWTVQTRVVASRSIDGITYLGLTGGGSCG